MTVFMCLIAAALTFVCALSAGVEAMFSTHTDDEKYRLYLEAAIFLGLAAWFMHIVVDELTAL